MSRLAEPNLDSAQNSLRGARDCRFGSQEGNFGLTESQPKELRYASA